MCEHNGNRYHMWLPATTVACSNAVVYLPATDEAGLAKPIADSNFTGSEIIFIPDVCKGKTMEERRARLDRSLDSVPDGKLGS